MGPVRRHPPRRARVRPGLIPGPAGPPGGRAGDASRQRLTTPSGRPYTRGLRARRAYPDLHTFFGPSEAPGVPCRGVPVSDTRSRADRPLPERLPLGEASRLLGVDPDTLRRWADEGRVPAFTTPGGHRRFERRALERLVANRRTGPAGGLAGLGATPDRLSAAYRRRYGEPHGAGLDPRTFIPVEERESFRESGRRLVDALV